VNDLGKRKKGGVRHASLEVLQLKNFLKPKNEFLIKIGTQQWQ